MASYRRTSPKFWQDPKVRQWSDQEKLLAQYLMTCSHRTTEGLFWLPKAYVAIDLGWCIEGVSEPLGRLIDDGFIAYDEASETVLLCKALKYQAPAGEKQIQGAINTLSEVPPSPLFPLLRDAAREFAPDFGLALTVALDGGPLKDHGSTFEAPSKGYRPSSSISSSISSSTPTTRGDVRSETGQDDQDDEQEATSGGGEDYSDEFEVMWDLYPRKTAKRSAFVAWTARVNEGESTSELQAAVASYAGLCEDKQPKHMLHGSTFFGPNERWRDYLPGGAALAEVLHLRPVVDPHKQWLKDYGDLSRPLEELL